jgi:peptide deformylase
MTVRKLRHYPDPILRQVCVEVESFDDRVGQFLTDLGESLYAHEGVGLAAPQIGEAIRVCVVDVEQREGTPKLIELVNPEVIEASDELREYEEGCLSFPGEAETVFRPARVKVRYQDRSGAAHEISGEGLLATALQHEIDHLSGVLFIDKISRLKRSLVERRMKKRAKASA